MYISNISCVTSYGMAVENSVWALTEEQLASVGTAKLERAEVDKSKHEMYAFRLKRPRSTLQVEFWLAYCPVTVRNLRRNRLTDLILLTLVLLMREKRDQPYLTKSSVASYLLLFSPPMPITGFPSAITLHFLIYL